MKLIPLHSHIFDESFRNRYVEIFPVLSLSVIHATKAALALKMRSWLNWSSEIGFFVGGGGGEGDGRESWVKSLINELAGLG